MNEYRVDIVVDTKQALLDGENVHEITSNWNWMQWEKFDAGTRQT